uniref:Transcription initiation factor IIA subunit 2 n=2 Tax=Cyprinus carpio TaxID=7962 RepID=A0A8C1T995_CYPCA
MAYQLYRNTTLGNSLQESLDELIQGSLNTYRFCDNVWTFVLNDVEFREVTDLVKVDKVKIVPNCFCSLVGHTTECTLAVWPCLQMFLNSLTLISSDL